MSKKGLSALSGMLAVILLTVIDQFTKYLAFTRLRGQASVMLIPGVFELEYVENRGAAFGLFADSRWIFMIGSLVVFLALLFLYYRLPLSGKYRPLRMVCIGLCAGAVGNMIDRIWRGYVIDFFYFSLIDFPVFNVADCYVVLSIAVFLYLFFFCYKEEDFAFLQKGRKKDEN
ncbi:MAG: signal peptidase II [Candidatus Limivivens sp.]|nr:signal peptidase II [Candidatus Limivivens sp.]